MDDKRLDTPSELARLEQQLDELKAEMRQYRRRGRRQVWFGALVIGVAYMGSVTAQPVISSLHVFSAGEPARANHVNQNFAFLQNWIEEKVGASDDPNVVVEGNVTNNCPVSSAAAGERHGYWVDGPTTNPLFFGLESRSANSGEWDGVIEWSEGPNDRLRFRARSTGTDVMTLHPNGNVSIRGELNGYAGRRTYNASSQGNTTRIPEADVIRFCGDEDGCQVIIAMFNWDNTRRTASRTDHFYYDATTQRWRDLHGDTQGRNAAEGRQHIQAAWSCYFTDGTYVNGQHSDLDGDFGILNWSEYSGETCRLTLID